MRSAVVPGALRTVGPGAATLLLAACSGSTHSLGTDCLPSGTERDLQAAIDTRDRVLLCPRAVFTLNATVVLRQGLTLETAHRPSQAADMATLVLGPDFSGDNPGVVGSGSDIQIANVRFDGNRRGIGPRDMVELLHLGPGDRYDVTGCVFDDALGWTHLHLMEPCDDARIVGNSVESAVRPHDGTGHTTDGMSVSCAHSWIEDNRIVDVSGVGIVYFGGPGTTIRKNQIVQSTTSAFSGINVGDAVRKDHTGVVIEQNTVTATGSRYFHIGIAAGLHAWRIKDVLGVTVRDNLISGTSRYGLAVDGCVDCVVLGNQITDWKPLPTFGTCPAPAAYVASVADRHAGGVLQSGYVDANIDGCLGAPIY